MYKHTPKEIEQLKRAAKRLHKSAGVALAQALDQIASGRGFVNWSLLMKHRAVHAGIAYSRSAEKGKLADVYHHGLFGLRSEKYQTLGNARLEDIQFKRLDPTAPYYFFVPTDDTGRAEYESFVGVESLFVSSTMGFVSANDELNISFSAEAAERKISDLLAMDEGTWRRAYNRKKDARDWTLATARADAEVHRKQAPIQISYRPFDKRWSLYTGQSRGLYSSPQAKVMSSLTAPGNVALICVKHGRNADYHNYFVSDSPTDKGVISSLDNSNVFPLFVQSEGLEPRRPNLNPSAVGSLLFSSQVAYDETLPEQIADSKSRVAGPHEIFDYVYAVLFSPVFRASFKSLLKVGFPRVPPPSSQEQFWALVDLGRQLRTLHLDPAASDSTKYPSFPVAGTNEVEVVTFSGGTIAINAAQYFANVPESAWSFRIGGYEPVQKWLKDRRGQKLSFEDIRHFQRVTAAVDDTQLLMQRIGQTMNQFGSLGSTEGN